MWRNLLLLVVYALVAILLIAIIAGLLLAIGTALTFLFAVSVWEATVVVTVVAAGAFWLLYGSGLHDHVDEYAREAAEEEGQPRIYVTDLPFRTSRSGKKRRR